MPTQTKKQKPGTQAALIRRLMIATGLSDECCRLNLLRRTRPRNPLVAKAWDKAMAEASQQEVR